MNATYIDVFAKINRWVDLSVNGIMDWNANFIPLIRLGHWCPLIELKSGQIVNWPTGMTARIHLRVCERDSGYYWLLDENKKRIAKWIPNCVPNDFLCHGENGHGDSIIISVNTRGYIYDYKKPEINRIEWAVL